VIVRGCVLLRELMIRFGDDGEVYREIDEKRSYFLNEAEKIAESIRVRLKNEKRVASPKEFECWVEGTRLIITHVRFDNEQSLEEQLINTMLKHEHWEEGLRHKYVNLLKDYAAKERELFVHKEFKAFAIRFDQYMGSQKIEPFPLLLGIEPLKKLFDNIFLHVSTGFYSELEEIMRSINKAYQTIVNHVNEELLQLEDKDYDGSFVDFLKVRVNTWFGNEENFHRFKKYVSAYYQSVTETQIKALYPKFETYQRLQYLLFTDYIKKFGYDDAYRLNNELTQAFYKKYDDILFEGFAIGTDDLVESLVLSPIIVSYHEKITKKPGADNDNKEVSDDAESVEAKEVAVQ